MSTTLTSPLDFINQPSLVVIIDCWNTNNPQSATTACNIRTWCETDPNVVAIGVASYHGMDNLKIYQEEPWWSAGKSFFYDTVRWETLRNIWKEPKHVPGARTHPVISAIKPRTDQRMFVMWHELQVLYYCNTINSSIKNIYVVGQSWDNCVRSRPVGWITLQCLNNINFFNSAKQILSRKDCILGDDSQPVEQVQTPWTEITDNILQLT
jgi:hypothetical protein